MQDRNGAGDLSMHASVASPRPGFFTTEPLYRRSGPEGSALDFNAAWLAFTERSMAESTGRGWLDAVHPGDRERCAAIHAAMLPARLPYALEYRLLGAACGHRWMLEQVSPVIDHDSRFSGFAHHVMDLHEKIESGDRVADRLAAVRGATSRHARFEAALADEVDRLAPARIGRWLKDMARLAHGTAALRRSRVPVAGWLVAAESAVRAQASAETPLRAARQTSPRTPRGVTPTEERVAIDDRWVVYGDADWLTSSLADVIAFEASAGLPSLQPMSSTPPMPPLPLVTQASRHGDWLTIDLRARADTSAAVLFECVIDLHGGAVVALEGGEGLRVRVPLMG